ncbi:MAG: SAM-dependent methyltransferase [Spirochaetes bacterium]|nr:SAM-dependent methyltransferase [Spirochaetota bacterium]
MLITYENREKLNTFFLKTKLSTNNNGDNKNKEAKINQIIAYLEIIHSLLRKYSLKRNLTLIDCGAGNCYLSFLTYYFYQTIDQRKVTIYCIDNNQRLMNNNRVLANQLGFQNMFFQSCDILDFSIARQPQIVYSLHACDQATDKTLYLGVKHNAANILSVSCCQHSMKKQLKKHPCSGITKYNVFKDKFTYMIGDSLRALLMESAGYQANIIEFVSSRYTDKNVMLRATKSNPNKILKAKEEYQQLSQLFNIRPILEGYLSKN